MNAGKAEINQTIALPVNMYFDLEKKEFQEKKAPKGDKQAGVVYVDLSKPINQKIQTFENTYSLEKCPVKKSEVFISITHEYVGEKQQDSMSQASTMMLDPNPSTISIQSTQAIQPKSESRSSQQKDQLKALQKKIADLQRQNANLQTQLQNEKKMSKALSSGDQNSALGALKQQLSKQKQARSQLQRQLQNFKSQNARNEQQLHNVRLNMQSLYDTLSKQF